MAEITMTGYRCERCSHEWLPRNKVKPVICPKCKSAYWNRPARDRKEAGKAS
jgi:predicted Zn-ribbon and HTH transcriptional regulator